MKKLLALILALGSLVCSAQNNTPTCPVGGCVSPNLVYSTTNPYNGPTPVPYTWSGFAITESTGGGTSGGNQPGYNTTTGTFMFGYTQGTIAYNYALSTALKNSGMTWNSYTYGWEYLNEAQTRGSLSASLAFNAVNGTVLHSKNWTMPKAQGENGWTTVSGTETFTNPLAAANINSFNLSFTGVDDRFWAGYYGPQLKNISLKVNYTVDACSSNPLSSPTCPGYAEAYKTQQCTANPLSDPTCPGYAVALKTQQCASNPMSDPTCPNYQTYLNEQCLIDSLFSTLCEGYKTAYAIKYIVNLDPAVTSAVNQQLTTQQETYKNDPARVTVVSTTVDSVLITPTTTTATSASPTSVTSVINRPQTSVAAPASPVATAAVQAVAPPPLPPPAVQAERRQDQQRTDAEVSRAERRTGGDPQEAKKVVGQQAKDISRDVARANTLEVQVAKQGLLVGLIGYVPGFTGYQQATVPDTNAVELARKYSKPVVDNQSAQRRLQGASDRLHREMVDSQYRND